MGGSAPRILALDDYFMVETEKEDKDPETGRKVITKVIYVVFTPCSNMNGVV
jgi:YLP motif-containing protein 1